MRPTTPGQPVTAGLVTAVVGFTSAFAVVLAGLRAVGATPEQAASGLLAVTVAMGLATIALAVTTRLPITVAWSTPGAALLAATGAADGGWPAAVGAFVLTGLLLMVVGLWRPLRDLAARIPPSVAAAMLAGVLLPLCLAPVRALAEEPLLVAPVVVVWLVLLRLSPRWAAPAALALATVLAFSSAEVRGLGAGAWAPSVVWTTPELTAEAAVSLALPLLVVTMASQNVPGLAVLAGFGYTAPVRAVMLTTGAGTVLAAPFGGHAINLAAISAALAAGPEAGPDRSQRWRAALTAGIGYVVIGLLSVGVSAVALAAPGGLIEAAAGVALVATLGAALRTAFRPPPTPDEQPPTPDEQPAAPDGQPAASRRDDLPAAAVTLLVTVSGVTLAGIGAAFWGLVAGLLVLAVLHVGRAPVALSPPATRVRPAAPPWLRRPRRR